MKAPYLIINGHSIEIGTHYWTVSKADFTLNEHIAGSENNVPHNCYFESEEEAQRYQAMAKLLTVLAPQVRAIEQRCQGDGFRMREIQFRSGGHRQ